MKVFIENEAASNRKNIYNEKTLKYIETIEVAREYPYPYGFILDTTGEDGDNVDVFILTEQKLKSGQIVVCKPIGLMEQFEKSWNQSKLENEETDHNILAILQEEEETSITETTKAKLTEFVTHIFDNIRKNKTRVGRFLSKTAAIQYIENHKD